MEALFIYLVKSAALMGIFFVAYYLLLRKETFFKSNRWYLLFGLVTSVILPLVTFKKVIWIDPAPAQGVDWNTVSTTLSPAELQPETFEVDWLLVGGIVYLLGLLFFVAKFATDFYALHRMLRGKIIRQQEDYKLVDVKENVSPFSYFSYIVYNSSLYTPGELANILEHEKVHSSQNHTADVLFSRFFCIVFWFSPLVWFYKKAMLQNLEFIADNEAAKNIADKKAYQITLLKITTHDCCVAITNHFYQSLIKKRIVMLNKNQSKKWNSWKYALIVPALAAFMIYFQVKIIAQERALSPLAAVAAVQEGVVVVVDKNATNADLKNEASRLKKEHGITLKFSKVKRNSSGEITAIKAEYKDKDGKKGVHQVSGSEPIRPIRFYKNEDGRIGFGGERNVRVYGVADAAIAVPVSEEDEDEDYTYSFNFNEDAEAPEAPEAPETPEAPGSPVAPESPGRNSKNRNIHVTQTNGGKPTVIINGKVIESEAEIKKIMAELKPLQVKGMAGVGGTYGYSYSDNAIIVDSKRATEDAMREARRAMREARAQIRAAGPQLEEAHRALRETQIEMEKSSKEISGAEMEKVRREIEQARAEIKKAQEEIRKTVAEMDKEKQEAKKQKRE